MRQLETKMRYFKSQMRNLWRKMCVSWAELFGDMQKWELWHKETEYILAERKFSLAETEYFLAEMKFNLAETKYILSET